MSQPVSVYKTYDASVHRTGTDGVAVTGTNTYYGTPISCGNGDGFSVHAEWTGTLTGTLTIWKSDKPAPNLASDADWVQDTTFGSAGSVSVSGAGKYSTSASNAKNRWWRLKYVNATNSGTIYAWMSTNRTA